MSLLNFSKCEQRNQIIGWYEINGKGLKNGKKLTWDQFGGKVYLKSFESMCKVLRKYEETGIPKISEMNVNLPNLIDENAGRANLSIGEYLTVGSKQRSKNV